MIILAETVPLLSTCHILADRIAVPFGRSEVDVFDVLLFQNTAKFSSDNVELTVIVSPLEASEDEVVLADHIASTFVS